MDDERWIAVEFSKTLLRVGAPWGELEGAGRPAKTIIPVMYGNPNANYDKYNRFITSLAAATDLQEVVVVLDIFNDLIKYGSGAFEGASAAFAYTDSLNTEGTSAAITAGTGIAAGTAYTQCFRSGNPCPDNNAVCLSEYC